MATVYKSKLGWETIVIILVMLVPYFVISFNNFNWLATVSIVGLLFCMVLFSYTSTVYTVSGDILLIKSMVFYKKQVKIASIRKIVATRNLSSPAPSLDRIEIWYNGYESVMLSPKDKEGFVKHLQHINPVIEYVPRKSG
jgi:hypothetical protein